MYNNKKILAFIPARKGSKRIKNKNIVKINKKPLFQYSLDVAKSCSYIDDIIVSTDSRKILNDAHKQGCIKNKLRPKNLSNDKARIVDAIIYEIKENLLDDYDVSVLLQPTSPYRSIKMLNDAIEKYFEYETSLITVVKSNENPIFMRIIENDKLKKVINDSSDIRSQDFKQYYKIIGSIYINNLKLMTNETILNENEIPFEIESKYNIDIDTYEDLKKAKEELEL